MNPLATPLEHHHFQRYSSSEEVAGFLRALTAAAGPYAKLERIGQSAQGREILALVCDASAAAPRSRAKLRVLMVGSQHGASEAAGCEALLYLARAVLLGDLQGLLDDFELVLIPNANPDGRELDSSRNGNDININRDYVLLSQPESCALDAAVLRYAPEVVLDAHESASLKRHTLGREGYLTDFEAQFDVANSPAIPPALLRYAETEFLPALIRGVEARGLHAALYPRNHLDPATHYARGPDGAQVSQQGWLARRLDGAARDADGTEGGFVSHVSQYRRARRQAVVVHPDISRRDQAAAASNIRRTGALIAPCATDPDPTQWLVFSAIRITAGGDQPAATRYVSAGADCL